MMASQNFSSGTHEEPEKMPVVTTTPDPYKEGVVPNEDVDVDERLHLTNNQRYFETLVNPGSTNIMLLGKEPTGFNFDTIMILNIDKTEKKMKIISLPRDIYVDYTDEIIAAVRKVKPSYPDEGGFHRINATPNIGQYINYKKGTGRFEKTYVEFLADIIDEIFGIYINDYAYVKVTGFRNIVDYFGGVTVDVPVHMEYSDPYQDLEIYIKKGTQHLNGFQAEGFVRFRQGYDENGDFKTYGDIFRKSNQSRFIKAFISQHVTLKNLGKLGDVADIISANVNTSVKGWNSIVEYGALAEEALNNKYPIENVDLQLTDKMIHGSSYILIKEKEN